MTKPPEDLIPIAKFCADVGISRNVLTQYWAKDGRAPQMVRRSNHLFITLAAWDAWEARRDADRQRLGKPHLRSPERWPPRPDGRGRKPATTATG